MDQDPRSAEREAAPHPPDADLQLDHVADSVDEERAIVRGRGRRAKEGAHALIARAEAAQADAQSALDLAVSALAEADGLRRAMQTRADIDIAKGILMERHHVDPQRAFEMLTTLSQKHHRKLLDIARAIVRSTTTTRK